MHSNLPGAESWRCRSRHSLLNLIYCYAAATVRMCQRHLWSVEDISLTGRSLFCSSLLIKHKLMRPIPRFSGPAPATVAAVVTPAFLTAEYITWCISSQTSRSCTSTNYLGNSIVFPAFLLKKKMGMGGVFCETRARTGELFLLVASKKLPIRVCFFYIKGLFRFKLVYFTGCTTRGSCVNDSSAATDLGRQLTA